MPPNNENKDPQDFQRLRAIFESDGTDIRRQLLLAGLLLMIFERFKRYAVAQVDGFYAHSFEIREGDLTFVRGQKFKALIKEKGQGKPGQHANKDFRAALHWFFEAGAITQDEFEEVERLYARRNEIGHELFAILADDTKHPLKVIDVATALVIYIKIVRWWVREVEIATDPDMTAEKYESISWDEVQSIDTELLLQILNKSLADDPEWKALQAFVGETTDVP
jgi:hypothetical protein